MTDSLPLGPLSKFAGGPQGQENLQLQVDLPSKTVSQGRQGEVSRLAATEKQQII